MRYRLQRHDGTDCSATMVPITVLRMVPIQRYRQERVGKLNKAIKKLDAEERALISLFYNEEKTIGEIALILGLTESNAKVKLHRIRKKLYILITEAE